MMAMTVISSNQKETHSFHPQCVDKAQPKRSAFHRPSSMTLRRGLYWTLLVPVSWARAGSSVFTLGPVMTTAQRCSPDIQVLLKFKPAVCKTSWKLQTCKYESIATSQAAPPPEQWAAALPPRTRQEAFPHISLWHWNSEVTLINF